MSSADLLNASTNLQKAVAWLGETLRASVRTGRAARSSPKPSCVLTSRLRSAASSNAIFKMTDAVSPLLEERLRGVVERSTYHDPDSGWAVLRVAPLNARDGEATVTVHQTRVFVGATMEFTGCWVVHPRFGRQFKAAQAVEMRPASAAALEKYLGSGLIKGIGPKTAQKIVSHFGKDMLEVFEEQIRRLTEVPGIAVRSASFC